MEMEPYEYENWYDPDVDADFPEPEEEPFEGPDLDEAFFLGYNYMEEGLL